MRQKRGGWSNGEKLRGLEKRGRETKGKKGKKGIWRPCLRMGTACKNVEGSQRL